MFFIEQSSEKRRNYTLYLKAVGALSHLSSDNPTVPYLYYRMLEKVFCRVFGAEDLSRRDIAIDAKVSCYGIGLKTFLYRKGNSMEKISEFNKDNNFERRMKMDYMIDTG